MVPRSKIAHVDIIMRTNNKRGGREKKGGEKKVGDTGFEPVTPTLSR